MEIMTKKITIEVSAYDTSCGVYIGDEYLKGAIWELENIGGKYISSIYVPPSGGGMYIKPAHFIAEFEFECKVESPFIQPHMVIKY